MSEERNAKYADGKDCVGFNCVQLELGNHLFLPHSCFKFF
jgi:hypothetical protein